MSQILPPHFGVGTPEDSVQSCYTVTPKPPKADYFNLFKFGNKARLNFSTCVVG